VLRGVSPFPWFQYGECRDMITGMKIDNREDALSAAQRLLNADASQIANALLEAHLEGLEHARSQFRQGMSYQQIAKDLEARSEFVRAQISS
jgi:hypothetical protein